MTRNPLPCIGWETLHVTPPAQALFGGAIEVVAFNWHHETFAVPHGATRALFGTHCRNKGFTVGPHIGLQCHLEVTEDIVRDWCAAGAAELLAHRGPAVQAAEDIAAGLRDRLPRTREAAQRLYACWLAGVLQRQPRGAQAVLAMGRDVVGAGTPVRVMAARAKRGSPDSRIGVV